MSLDSLIWLLHPLARSYAGGALHSDDVECMVFRSLQHHRSRVYRI